jgi:hypothetical protein
LLAVDVLDNQCRQQINQPHYFGGSHQPDDRGAGAASGQQIACRDQFFRGHSETSKQERRAFHVQQKQKHSLQGIEKIEPNYAETNDLRIENLQ